MLMAITRSIKADEPKTVWGTREFLVRVNLEPIDGSERDVPDADVNEIGRYRPAS